MAETENGNLCLYIKVNLTHPHMYRSQGQTSDVTYNDLTMIWCYMLQIQWNVNGFGKFTDWSVPADSMTLSTS